MPKLIRKFGNKVTRGKIYIYQLIREIVNFIREYGISIFLLVIGLPLVFTAFYVLSPRVQSAKTH